MPHYVFLRYSCVDCRSGRVHLIIRRCISGACRPIYYLWLRHVRLRDGSYLRHRSVLATPSVFYLRQNERYYAKLYHRFYTTPLWVCCVYYAGYHPQYLSIILLSSVCPVTVKDYNVIITNLFIMYPCSILLLFVHGLVLGLTTGVATVNTITSVQVLLPQCTTYYYCAYEGLSRAVLIATCVVSSMGVYMYTRASHGST